MKVRQLNTTAAPVKWWAARDAQRRNDENRLLYTPNQQQFLSILHPQYHLL